MLDWPCKDISWSLIKNMPIKLDFNSKCVCSYSRWKYLISSFEERPWARNCSNEMPMELIPIFDTSILEPVGSGLPGQLQAYERLYSEKKLSHEKA